MRFLPAAIFSALLLFAACSGEALTPTPSPTSAPTPSPVPTPTEAPAPSPPPQGSADIGPASFDPARAFALVEQLAVDIGTRPAASDAEREAADHLREMLSGYGYDVEVQTFTYDVFQDAGSSLRITSPETSFPAVYPFNPNVNGAAEGRLVDAGIGRPEDFPSNTNGNIALIRRGILTFGTKVANAAAAGASGVVVYNSEAGLFAGVLDQPSTIPALAVSLQDGQALLSMMESGPVSVRLEVKTLSGPRESQNVVAQPPGGECRLVAGGHYDSVPAGPGANDNASGTATVVEMARVMAADGQFDDVCFVLFGAEEVGLIGSAEYVAALSDTEKDAMEGMLNFDMVGQGGRLLLAGSASMTDVAAAEAGRRGLERQVITSSGGGSDHASFINTGIPAVFFHSFISSPTDDPNYHTAGDTADNVRATRMAEIGELGLAVIEALLTGR